MEIQEFDPERYNQLDSIESAHALLFGRADRVELIQRLLNLILKYGFGERLGVFLLHRHFACPQKHVMLEHLTTGADGSPLYVTAATPQGVPASASRWSIGYKEGTAELHPLEFSDDVLVSEVANEVVRNRALFTDLGAELAAANATAILGVAVAVRKHQTVGSVLLERTSDIPPQSFARPTPASLASVGVNLSTLWTSRGLNGCCSPIVVCVPIEGGGHSRQGGGHAGCV